MVLGLSLVLIAFNGRAAVASVGPVLREILQTTGLSPAGASFLTTLPTVVFGFGAPLAPALSRRLGSERAVLLALLAVAAGCGIRALGSAGTLFAGQVLSCAGIAVINVALPGLVKRDFPERVPLMTGLVTMALCAGAAVAAGTTVPLSAAFGSWALALAFWASPGLLAAAVWGLQLPPVEDRAQARFSVQSLWRDKLAWQVTLFMGLQSSLAYILLGWLALILRDRGMAAVDAGLVLSFSVVVQMVASLIAPGLAMRGRDQRLAAAASVGFCLVGFLGCFFGPLGSVWLWAVVLGVSQGSMFALALMIIVLRAPNAAAVAHLSAMAQGVGYLVASAGPLFAGLLYASLGRGAVAGLIAAICLLGALAGLGAGRAVHVRG
ncbi:MAG: MFS transporter [Acetobacteraceae bacterium]|nr:MFS transporter [Acetobacteraceae bacterium]MBV8526244.1 MFS transporter [Acetobacteraceae bacterium]